MDQATQQNAALVEQSAAAAESLRLEAQRMVQAVAVFTLSPGAGSPAVAPTPQRASKPPAPVERRGPNRATNVVRPPFKKTALPKAIEPSVKTGTDGDWSEF